MGEEEEGNERLERTREMNKMSISDVCYTGPIDRVNVHIIHVFPTAA